MRNRQFAREDPRGFLRECADPVILGEVKRSPDFIYFRCWDKLLAIARAAARRAVRCSWHSLKLKRGKEFSFGQLPLFPKSYPHP